MIFFLLQNISATTSQDIRAGERMAHCILIVVHFKTLGTRWPTYGLDKAMVHQILLVTSFAHPVWIVVLTLHIVYPQLTICKASSTLHYLLLERT